MAHMIILLINGLAKSSSRRKKRIVILCGSLFFFLVENGWIYRFTFSSLENNMPLVFTDSLSPSQTHFLLFSQVYGRVAHKQLLYSSLVTADAASVEESIILTPFSAKRKFVVSECVLLLPIFLLSLIQQSQPLEPAIHPPSHFCFFLCVFLSHFVCLPVFEIEKMEKVSLLFILGKIYEKREGLVFSF